jgi:aryl-alcohol dehydrogenase-like predicted oxidoreductase
VSVTELDGVSVTHVCMLTRHIGGAVSASVYGSLDPAADLCAPQAMSAASSSSSVQLQPKGMEYVRLGSSGLKVSRIALGCMTYGTPAWREWVLDAAASKPFIRGALEAGINFFDTSDMYSLGESERVLGATLREFGTRREDVVIATKVYFASANANGPNSSGLSRKHIMDAIDASLERLQMKYVDLYQIHRWDNDCTAEEVMAALHDVVKSGKARYIGASSMYAWQFQHCQNVAEKNGWTKFVSMQNHYNLVYREEEREMKSVDTTCRSRSCSGRSIRSSCFMH